MFTENILPNGVWHFACCKALSPLRQVLSSIRVKATKAYSVPNNCPRPQATSSETHILLTLKPMCSSFHCVMLAKDVCLTCVIFGKENLF